MIYFRGYFDMMDKKNREVAGGKKKFSRPRKQRKMSDNFFALHLNSGQKITKFH